MIISGAVLTWTGLLLTNTASQIRSQATFGSKLRSLLDCPVPRLTLLFFGAAKDVPEAAKMVTAGTACLHLDQQANGQTGHCFQAALRPLKKCITKEITAMISKR